MSRGRSVVPHWNGDLLCAVDTETTGLDCNWHDIVQVSFLPLGADYLPDYSREPFYVTIAPDHPERWDADAARVNGLMETSRKHGLPSDVAYQLFVEWFHKLELPASNTFPYSKRLIVLAKNWAFDRGFLNAWMGKDDDGKPNLDRFINGRYTRDLQPVAHFFNDLAYENMEAYPFPKTSLTALCRRLGIEIDAHDALGDCEATAKCYAALMLLKLPLGKLDLGLVLPEYQ